MIFFDTDCLSAFLWVKREHLLFKAELGELVIPQEVFIELSNPCIRHLGNRMRTMIEKGHVQTMAIMTGTDESKLFYQMVHSPPAGVRPIGKGEASALVLAQAYGGIVASNNLGDISAYVTQFALKRITTGYILAKALEKNLIDEPEGDRIWAEMLARKRRLPTDSFSAYLKSVYPLDQVAASAE